MLTLEFWITASIVSLILYPIASFTESYLEKRYVQKDQTRRLLTIIADSY